MIEKKIDELTAAVLRNVTAIETLTDAILNGRADAPAPAPEPEAPKAEKPKAEKPKKAEPAPEPEAPKAEPEKPKAEKAATLDGLVKGFTKLMQEKGRDAGVALLSQFEVKKLSELKKDKYAEFAAAIDAAQEG